MNTPITARDAMTHTSLAPWFGAKRTLAPKIVEQLGPHHCYFEPFCGSMAVLLAKPVARQEAANDRHGDLVNLARVVADESLAARLYWRLVRTLTCEAVFVASRETVRASPPPPADGPPDGDRAYHYFVASWQGLNGVAGARTTANGFARRYSSKGGSPATRFVGATESVPWWHERLRRVEIYSTCGLAMCERIEDRAGTVVFADPPYFEKGKEYLHDFGPEDHDRLAAALERFRLTRVVLSYYAHPELDRLYSGWTRLALTTTKKLASASRNSTAGRIEAPEVLLVNGPVLGGAK